MMHLYSWMLHKHLKSNVDFVDWKVPKWQFLLAKPSINAIHRLDLKKDDDVPFLVIQRYTTHSGKRWNSVIQAGGWITSMFSKDTDK